MNYNKYVIELSNQEYKGNLQQTKTALNFGFNLEK